MFVDVVDGAWRDILYSWQQEIRRRESRFFESCDREIEREEIFTHPFAL
jgi:hypothetical protein